MGISDAFSAELVVLAIYFYSASISCGVFEAGSGFRVGRRTARGSGWGWGLVPFFGAFVLVLAKFSFWRGDWGLGYHSMGIRHFPNISSFPKILTLKSFGNSYIPCLKVITAHVSLVVKGQFGNTSKSLKISKWSWLKILEIFIMTLKITVAGWWRFSSQTIIYFREWDKTLKNGIMYEDKNFHLTHGGGLCLL